MTRTEERLTEALHAAARSVHAPGLRPLDDMPAPAPHGMQPRQSRRQLRLRFAAAAGAALAAAGITTAAVTTSGHLGGGRPDSQSAGAAITPRFYAISDPAGGATGRLEVRAAATGQLVATIPQPANTVYWRLAAARPDASGADTFYADYMRNFPSTVHTELIYRFRVTAAGQVTRPTDRSSPSERVTTSARAGRGRSS
jgi:hypothetical protein